MNQDIDIQTDRTLSIEARLYYDLYLPPAREEDESRPRPLLIALHGYGANKRQMMREARSFAPERFAIASLQGFHQHIREPKEKGGPLRYGFGWVTNFHPEDSIALHHHAVLELIDKLVAERLAARERVFLLGFSQSCALNYRFAFTHPRVLSGVVGICGGLPGDWETSQLYKETNASVLHLCGAEDEFYPPERTRDYEARLKTRAHDAEVRSYEAGHEIVPKMREELRVWLEPHA